MAARMIRISLAAIGIGRILARSVYGRELGRMWSGRGAVAAASVVKN